MYRRKVRGSAVKVEPLIRNYQPVVPTPSGISSLIKVLVPLIGTVLPAVGAIVVKKLIKDNADRLTKGEEKAVMDAIKKIEKQSKKGKGMKPRKKPIAAPRAIMADNMPKVSMAELEKILGAGIVEM